MTTIKITQPVRISSIVVHKCTLDCFSLIQLHYFAKEFRSFQTEIMILLFWSFEYYCTKFGENFLPIRPSPNWSELSSFFFNQIFTLFKTPLTNKEPPISWQIMFCWQCSLFSRKDLKYRKSTCNMYEWWHHLFFMMNIK